MNRLAVDFPTGHPGDEPDQKYPDYIRGALASSRDTDGRLFLARVRVSWRHLLNSNSAVIEVLEKDISLRLASKAGDRRFQLASACRTIFEAEGGASPEIQV